MAENYLIYYMLKNEKVLNMVENRVGYFPDKNIRELSNEIIYYFHKYGIINVADFISYISDREEIRKTLQDIIAMNIKEDFQEKEIEDYIFVVNEYHKEVRVNNLNKKLKEENIELIASENYVSKDILKLQGSILTNKYAEGYPGKKYYGGCTYIDEIENLAIDYACRLFHVRYANVQPHSGSSANMAVYKALLNIGDTVLGMDLSNGGQNERIKLQKL